MSKSINVRTPSGDYEVLIGSKLLGSYNFKWLVQNRQILIIKDSMVPNEILETLRISLSNSQPMEIKVLEIETNEKTKSFEGLIPIFEVLNANKFNNLLDKSKHLVMSAPHPSRFSARTGFFGCKHFSKANKFLQEQNRDIVDWSILELTDVQYELKV